MGFETQTKQELETDKKEANKPAFTTKSLTIKLRGVAHFLFPEKVKPKCFLLIKECLRKEKRIKNELFFLDRFVRSFICMYLSVQGI